MFEVEFIRALYSIVWDLILRPEMNELGTVKETFGVKIFGVTFGT